MGAVRAWATRFLAIPAALLVIVTLLPEVKSNEWWIRVWDYPRVQFFVVGLVVLLAIVWLSPSIGRCLAALLLVLGIATVYQAWRVAPYTPIWSREIADASAPDSRNCVSILIANVYMENRYSQEILRLVEEVSPDIVFIVENDHWWSEQFAPLQSRYDTVLDAPLDNTYGLLFMTKLDHDTVELRHLTEPQIPSVRARLRLPTGDAFTFYGVHPKPPKVGQDTDQRDNELARVAREVRQSIDPSIVGGDLNDVAWSHTTRLFKRISQMLDPRQGRGLFASFHADYPVLRWPLDHLFATDGFQIGRLAVLRHTGSDHFPVFAQFCLSRPTLNPNAEQEPMQGGDRREMRNAISPN